MDRGRVEDEDRLVEPGSDRDAVEVHRAGGERARGLGPDIPASGPGIAEGLGQGTYGSSPSALILPAALAELVGTFILVFGGTAVAVGAILSRPTAGAAYDSLAIALAFGLALAVEVRSCLPGGAARGGRAGGGGHLGSLRRAGQDRGQAGGHLPGAGGRRLAG